MYFWVTSRAAQKVVEESFETCGVGF